MEVEEREVLEFEEPEDTYEPEQNFYEFEVHKNPGYVKITHEWALSGFKKQVEKIGEIWDLHEREVIQLLSGQNWNIGKLTAHLSENSERIVSYKRLNQIKIDVERFDKCKRCYENKLLLDMTCGHKFCQDCWSKAITNEILFDRTSIKCLKDDCSKLVTLNFLKQLQFLPQSISRFQKNLLKEFCRVNFNTKKCISPQCFEEFKVQRLVPIRCSCGTTFCSKCSKQSHAPLSCDRYQTWLILVEEHKLYEEMIDTLHECQSCSLSVHQIGNLHNCQYCDHAECKLCRNVSQDEQCLIFLQSFEQQTEMTNFDKYDKMAEKLQQKFGEIDNQMLQNYLKSVIACCQIIKYSYALKYFLKDGLNSQLQLCEYAMEQLIREMIYFKEVDEMGQDHDIMKSLEASYKKVQKAMDYLMEVGIIE